MLDGVLQISEVMLIHFTFFFLFPVLDHLNWPTFKFATFLFCQLKSSLVPHLGIFYSVIVLFNYIISTWFFFYNFFLLIFCIWWDFVLILYFSSLDMVSFCSLYLFLTTNLKFVSIKSNVWASSRAVSIASFCFLLYGPYFCVSLPVSELFVEKWTC